jgi:hypothetical protein
VIPGAVVRIHKLRDVVAKLLDMTGLQ